MLVWLSLTLAANPVAAQTTTTYSNTTAGTINAATSCTAPLVRNFTIGASYVVGDVDLGLLATHSWRGDLRVTLQSPATSCLPPRVKARRSEEHTSELQSLMRISYAVFCWIKNTSEHNCYSHH